MKVSKFILGLLFSFLLPVIQQAQVTYTKDVATIIYQHCTSCHRPGEIGPMSLTHYDEVKNWSNTIKYVTAQKIMPPWKADPTVSHYLEENYLTDIEIKKISDWVSAGSPYGNQNEEPTPPNFPENSLLGIPDKVISFAKSYLHKGNGVDEYRYFVLPTGLTENKKLKALELRPGNTKIVHHALFFSDTTGTSKQYDDQTPEYGFEGNNNFGNNLVLNSTQYPGYVPGQKPKYYPDGLAQNMSVGTSIVVQMHYAPWGVDEADSSTVNLFFADENEIIDRYVKNKIMLPFDLVGGFQSFYILPNTKRTFEGVFTVPYDVSLIGIAPHMHYLGKNWEVYIENPDGSRSNLIKINDWDFNWQGTYYFDRFKIAKKGSKIHAFATYDNTKDNPLNPFSPPKLATWGEGTKDEMYYLPLVYVDYKSGDENVVFDQTSAVKDETDLKSLNIQTVFPNPASNELVNVTFMVEHGQVLTLELLDADGKLVRTIKSKEFFAQGSHVSHIQTQYLPAGSYFIKLTGIHNQSTTMPLIVSK